MGRPRRRARGPVILPESVKKYKHKRTPELKVDDVLFGEWVVTAPAIAARKDASLDRFMMRVPVRFIATGEERDLVLPRRARFSVKKIEETKER